MGLKPNAPIRRFDVFAEYNRLEAMKKGESAAQAKGYGIWLAKVVAAKKFAKKEEKQGDKETPNNVRQKQAKKAIRKKKWRDLSGIPQTDKLFDKEIVKRMGKEFYRDVFAPALQEAFAEGKEYREIRDAIRGEWKVEK